MMEKGNSNAHEARAGKPPEGAEGAVDGRGPTDDDHTAEVVPDPRWSEFAKAHAGHPALNSDAIYALPEALIDAICAEMRWPPRTEFFTPSEEQFERDLAKAAGAGFFLQRSFAYPLLSYSRAGNKAGEPDEIEKQWILAERRLWEMLIEDMRQSGQTEGKIKKYSATQARVRQKVRTRKRAFAGWLVTHPDFHRARDIFRDKWKSEVDELGVLPEPPILLMGESPPQPEEKYRDFYESYIRFCQRWSLHALVTWDLPLPMRPELVEPSFYELGTMDAAGVTIFVPWYLLRGKDITLQELAEHRRVSESPQHLQEWLERKPRNWGYDRFANMLELYIYLELCLKPRYGDRLRGRVEKLDRALGHLLHDRPNFAGTRSAAAETVRKIRYEISKRLKRCEAAEEEEEGEEGDEE